MLDNLIQKLKQQHQTKNITLKSYIELVMLIRQIKYCLRIYNK